MTLQEALDQIKHLEAQNLSLLAQLAETHKSCVVRVNPVYAELIAHLTKGPRSISELAEQMVRENRSVSQWLHSLKSKYGADIITLADGRKQLMNPEHFDKEEFRFSN